MKTRALLALAGCLLALSTRADDWPQFRGPNRDNASKETGLLKAWPEAGPKLLWTYKDAGTGYSGPAIVGDTLYTMGARGDDEFLIALDLTKTPPVQKWAEKIGPTFTTKGNIWNKGPSSSPTVANGYVYALGGFGDLICVTTDGKFIWRVALVKDLKGEINPIQNTPGTLAWGYAGSPLVDGDKLICVPGGPNGTVAALDAKKGNVVWRSVMFTEQATYTSPVMATLGGIKQYIVMVQDGVAGIDADGNLLWRYQRSILTMKFSLRLRLSRMISSSFPVSRVAPSSSKLLLPLGNSRPSRCSKIGDWRISSAGRHLSATPFMAAPAWGVPNGSPSI